MEMLLKCMVLVCAAYTAVSELKIKTLMANDMPNSLNDELTIMCEGNEVLVQDDIDTGIFKLQIVGHPAVGKPFIRELQTSGAVGDPLKSFSVTFSYSDDGGSDIIKEILKHDIELNLVILDSDETLKGQVTKKASLKVIQDEFPKGTTDLKYITDHNDNAGRWIRIDTATTSVIIGGIIDIPICDIAPCYTYESSFDDASNEYRQCDDVTMADDDIYNIYLCHSDEPTPPENLGAIVEDKVPDQIILDHADQLEVILKNAKGAEKVDLVVHKPGDPPTICTQGQGQPVPAQISDPIDCGTIVIDPDLTEYKVLLVGYTGTEFKWANDYKSHNHNIRTKMLSDTLLEALWDHNAATGTQTYLVKRNTIDETDNGLAEAYVDCSAIGGADCTSFFFGVPLDGSYTVTIQDVNNYNGGISPDLNPVSVRSDVATTLKAEHKNQIVIHKETIKTEVIDNNMIIEVCFENLKNISMKDFYYEFLIVNSKGQWKRERKLNMKSDSYSCFHPVEAAISDFKENSKALVLLRNTKDRNVLASAEVKFQVPEAAIAHTGDNSGNASSNTVWIIVGTSAGFLACLVALVALIYTKIIKRGERDDGIQYPLQRNIIENSKIIQGLDNPASTI